MDDFRSDVTRVMQGKPIEKETYMVYTVKKGDSLWAIAKKYLGTGWAYTEIKTLNGLKTNNIYPGQKLNIPMK